MRLAVLWQRFGPYHWARLNGLGSSDGGRQYQVEAIEVCSKDAYAWDPVDSQSDVSRTTLFGSRDYDSLGAREIRMATGAHLARTCPDVVAINGWFSPEARAALSWCAARRIPSVVMSETKRDDSRRYFWKEAFKRWVLRSASAGLVGGRLQAEYLNSLGISREKIFLGYNAVDNGYFSAEADRSRREAAYPMLSGEAIVGPYFFACSRFLPRKNLDGLLRSYSLYRSIHGARSWPLVISGDGPDASRLRSLSSSLGVASHVRWPGFVQYDNLPRWYSHAGAFIHPAKAEAWGLVVNEAAACGLPLLVARPVGARFELVEDGVNGLLFDPGSDEAIADALVRISSMDSGSRSAFGAAAKARVDDFGPRRFAEGLLKAIEAARESGS